MIQFSEARGSSIYIYIYILEPRASLNGTKLNFTCRLDHSCVLLVRLALVWCNFSETDRNTISGFGVNTKKTMKFGVITKKAVKFGVITKKTMKIGVITKKAMKFGVITKKTMKFEVIIKKH